MKFVPNAVTKTVARQILVGRKHSPTVLFAGGVVGVVASTVLACRATLKLDEVLAETQVDLDKAHTLMHKDYSAQDRTKDVAIIRTQCAISIVKLYAPAIVVGGLGIAALTGSHNILTKRNAALTAAYAALEKGFDEYRKRVISELGEDKDREFRYGTQQREILDDKAKPKTVTTVPDGTPSVYARFFDECSTNWDRTPEYNRLFLSCQQNYANDKLRARGHLFLNEVYDMLGIERTKAGAVVGWVINDDKTGDNFVDFGLYDGSNPRARDFVNGREGSILLDFNVDGVIYNRI